MRTVGVIVSRFIDLGMIPVPPVSKRCQDSLIHSHFRIPPYQSQSEMGAPKDLSIGPLIPLSRLRPGGVS